MHRHSKDFTGISVRLSMRLSQGLGCIYKDILATLKKHIGVCSGHGLGWDKCLLFMWLIHELKTGHAIQTGKMHTEISRSKMLTIFYPFMYTPFGVMLLGIHKKMFRTWS